MPIVRNRDNGLLYDFDPTRGDLTRVDLVRIRPSAIQGEVGRVGTREAVLWTDSRELVLRLEGRDFPIEPNLIVEALDTGGIRVVRDGLELHRVPYVVTRRENEAPTHDFGVFLVEVLANPAHREALLQRDPRSFLLRGNNLCEETLAMIAEQLPDRTEAMQDEILRWFWRWEPVAETLQAIAAQFVTCHMCGSRTMTRPESLCGPCTGLTRRLVPNLMAGTDANTDLVLADSRRAILSAALPHSEFLVSELERRAALATPRTLPLGSACDVCGRSEHPILRGVRTALCPACLVRRGARPD